MPVPKLVITAGLMLANMALTMTRKIEGPRLDDLKFTGGDYGVPLPMVWGMRRVQVPIFWAENLREVKRRRKTKGGKFNEYTYYGTWAVALAGHEIDAVRRIWFDTHLIYDLSGAGPVTPFDFGANRTGSSLSEYVTIYLGTDNQLPDPRMQATVEAEFGEGSCPAYRDTAYIVFKDIPLEKIGNRIPQVSVEMSSGPNFPSELVDFGSATSHIVFSQDYSTIQVTNISGEYFIVDTATRSIILQGEVAENTGFGSAEGYLSDGTMLWTTSPGSSIVSVPFGGSTSTELTQSSLSRTFTHAIDSNGIEHWFSANAGNFIYDDAFFNGTATVGRPFFGTMLFADVDGALWIVGRGANTSTEAVFYRIDGAGDGTLTIVATGLPSNSNDCFAFHYSDSATDHFVLSWAGNVYAIDRATGDVLHSNTSVATLGNGYNNFRAIPVRSATFWMGFAEISSADLSLVRQLDYGDWTGSASQDIASVYDPVNHALITRNPSTTLRWNFLDRVGVGSVLLSTIASDVAGWCGVEDYDFSDLDQEITGWSATRGPASNMIEPLLDFYDSDFRPHDFTIQGIKRTGATAGATLLTERFVGEPRYGVKVRQSSELPKALIVDFADIDAEQQPNSVRSDRPLDATDARGEKKIDLTTLALGADEARGLADRHFRRVWNERREVSLGLTAQNLALEPGDVRALSLDGETMGARCVRVTVQADDVLQTEWRYDHPSLALLSGAAGAQFDGRDPQKVVVPVLSKGFVLDVPLLSDSDDAVAPQVYPLAAPFAVGAWPGATVYQSVDGEYSEELATVPSSGGAAWGYVSGAMPYANPNLWDRGTEITVTLQAGDLTGCTEAAANASPTLNLAAIGADGRWEIVQFTVATLTAPLTYTVSGFKRGRRGTEWAAELHEAGDHFVLLENADAVAMGLSEVGTDVSFKAITAGRTSGFPFGYEYEGQSLKPYAPVHLKAVKEDSGDWTFTWVRRTRVGGAWTSGTTIPLGEASEEYELTLGDGVTTVTKAPTSETYTWSVAEQTSDTGAEVMAADLEWSVAQVSDAVGAGFLATA